MSAPESRRERTRPESRPESNVVNLGPQDSVVGALHIEGNLNVMGKVEGEIVVNGDVVVQEGATVQASIAANNINILGEVVGNVSVSHRLQLSGHGDLKGDARVGSIVVESGATFNGAITMNSGEAAPGSKWGESSFEGRSTSLLTDSTDGKSARNWIEELESDKELGEKAEAIRS